MITFEESFTANGSPDAVFELLADAARVVECLPGASLDSAPGAEIQAGDEMAGRFELKIGPIKTRFAATVRVLEFDREQRRYVLGVHAQDSRGNGEVESTVALAATASDAGTQVHAHAELEIRGRIATFGTATVERVSQRVLQQFAENLARAIEGGAAVAPPVAAAPAGSPAATTPAVSAPTSPVPAPAPAGAVVVSRPGGQNGWAIATALLAFACGYLLARAGRRGPAPTLSQLRWDLGGRGRHRR